MILKISTLVGVLDGVEPLPRVRSMIASTRLRRAMRSSSSFFSRSSISLRNLKINKVTAMIIDIEIFLIAFSKMQTLFSVTGQDSEVSTTESKRGMHSFGHTVFS